ncbi:MAG: methylase domain protein [Dehalococcoidia bacterium]|nr:methylase domain protein [Dehalococcoidia bacterium]
MTTMPNEAIKTMIIDVDALDSAHVPSNQIICSDAALALRKLPSSCVHCIVTSPPYYGQRDYSTSLQIGNEQTPSEYVGRLLEVFNECLRVLDGTGTFWLNLGDKYENGRLLGMPWRVALALQDAGWILRADIIWHKTNAMPSPVSTRPTQDHEYLFLFSKNHDYYYDADSIREPHITFTEKSRMKGGRGHFGKVGGTPEKGKNGGNPNLHKGRWDQAFHPSGRNKRTVWSIPLSKNRDVHFAVFPERLVEPAILAGCKPDGIVLDPFLGTGTSALVAIRLGRRFVGIDSNRDYCKIAERNLQGRTHGLALEMLDNQRSENVSTNASSLV